MARFARRPLPRRALVAAMLGAVYALLLLPAPQTPLGVNPIGAGWFLLAVSLLFLTPLAYHVYTTWSIVWVVWRGVAFYRDGGHLGALALDLALPLVSVALLMSSGYLPVARAWRDGAPVVEAE